MKSETYLAACVEAAINRILALDPELGEDIAALEGSVLELHLQGIERCLRLWPRRSGVAVETFTGAAFEPLPRRHLRISAPPATMLRLLARGEPLNGALPEGVAVSGDMHLAQRLGELLRGAALDWEEPLAAVLGDSVAHEVGRGMRGLFAWMREASDTLLLDVGEYLREERAVAPDAAQVEDLASDIERLRDDVDRLEQRIARLGRTVWSADP